MQSSSFARVFKEFKRTPDTSPSRKSSRYAPSAYSVPMVVEQTTRSEHGYDIFSLLLKNHIVFLGTRIDDVVANPIVAQRLYLARDEPDHEIQMYITPPAGRSMLAWRSMTPCISSSRGWRRRVSVWPPAWAPSCSEVSPEANVRRCQIRAF